MWLRRGTSTDFGRRAHLGRLLFSLWRGRHRAPRRKIFKLLASSDNLSLVGNRVREVLSVALVNKVEDLFELSHLQSGKENHFFSPHYVKVHVLPRDCYDGDREEQWLSLEQLGLLDAKVSEEFRILAQICSLSTLGLLICSIVLQNKV